MAPAAAAQEGSPAGPVPVERLAARRAALLDAMGVGVAILRSAELRSIERDYPQDGDYREDNDFFYLTGLEAPGAWLALVARDSGPGETVLFLPHRDSATATWTGSTLGPAMARRLSGIDSLRSAAEAESAIQRLVFGPGSTARAGSLYLHRRPRDLESPFLRRLVFSDGAAGQPVGIDDLGAVIARLRLVKDEEELARLRRAIAVTGDGLRAAMASARPGIWEYELEAILEFRFRRGGAERLGFPSIVASGPNALTLHYDRNRRRTAPGDLVVMDVGAEYGYLTADVTRTIPVSGRFTPRQRALYDLVLGAAQAALDSVRPGTDLRTLDRIARAHLRERSDTLCGTLTCDRYFIHGLSHWLGMDVHDVGSYATPLAPGMVFTIEPGVYLPDEGVGIRIEDVILVTGAGAEVLSAGIPRTADEVERSVGTR